MMTDEEYRELLDALARKHLRIGRMHGHHIEGPFGHLRYEIGRLSRISRFVHVVEEAVEDNSAPNDLVRPLAHAIQNSYLSSAVNAMEESGVLDALDEAPSLVLGNLRRSVIPPEDEALLRRAGVEDPDAEIKVLIQKTRQEWTYWTRPSRENMPSVIVNRAADQVNEAGKELAEDAELKENRIDLPKKRRILNGVGKILAGAITGAGNVLIGLGSIAVPNPAVGYTVIGSCALAVGSIFQGLGDLRGE